MFSSPDNTADRHRRTIAWAGGVVQAVTKVDGKTMPKTTNTVKPKTDRRKATKSAQIELQSELQTLRDISEADIARRAFEVYCSRGGQHGRDLEDWLQAERELRSQLTQAAH
jgi:tRNA 2-selenouridine synthase SelU